MITLAIEVRSDDGAGPVQYTSWELPLRLRRRKQQVAEAHLQDAPTPLGLVLNVEAEWWPAFGQGGLTVGVAGDPELLADLSPLATDTWLILRLPSGERLSIRARK